MSVFSNTAKNCFEENCGLIDSNQNPVEWNLNNGLANLAQAIAGLENDLRSLSHEVGNLEQDLSS